MAVQTTSTATLITTTEAPITGYPFTIASTAKWSSLSATGLLVVVNNNGTTSVVQTSLSGATAGDPAAFSAGTTYVSALSTTAYSNTDWNYVAGVGNSSSSRTVYLNAGSSGSNTATRTPSGWDRMAIGQPLNTGTLVSAEVAIWSATLTVPELESLAKGFRPFRIRPQSLVFYAPLVRDRIEISGGITLNDNGTTTVAHPRVY